MKPIIFENKNFRLALSPQGAAESLILKKSGEELLANTDTPFFSLTEERPYNNEVKLAQPMKRTTFSANSLRLEGDQLIIGFEKIHFEAVVQVEIKERYMIFTLVDFLVHPDSFGYGVLPILPPVSSFRLVQLALKPREQFGEWLNALWDEKAAINVLSACPYPKIGAEERRDHKILFGETLSEVRLKNAGVALIAAPKEELLDSIEALEIDRNLPRGVESRRAPNINHSYYWTNDITPENADAYIATAQKGGFTHLLIYYSALLNTDHGYWRLGDYKTLNPAFKNGKSDLIALLEKIKAAGITPGLHILHTHIGLKSRYLTPQADHRLNLTRQFTLAKECSAEDTTLYVEEYPDGVPEHEPLRVLKFMGELIQYESVSAERPYCFKGCKRGYNGTIPKGHEIGTIGGILEISEFGAQSVYIDQKTSLQDEIAEEIAELYDAGFEFLYFDGSEGINPPSDINVGLAQWKVYNKLSRKPRFCEGAAKSHFSWHMLSGGNAFDVFPAAEFKKMTVLHPFKEAPQMQDNFTRVNFGWWRLSSDQRPDIFEYGTALAAAWDCPGAFCASLERLATHPRTDDILETFRRWEMARQRGFLTKEMKEELKKTEIEHTLLIDEAGALELCRWEQLPTADERISAFYLKRQGRSCIICWNNAGEGALSLPLTSEGIRYLDEIGGEEIAIKADGASLCLPLGKKRYLLSDLSKEELTEAFKMAHLH